LKKISEYYEHARECRELARSSMTEEHRASLENMARTWEGLAHDREARIQRLQRLAEIEHGGASEATDEKDCGPAAIERPPK
jgi:hypothetical protein